MPFKAKVSVDWLEITRFDLYFEIYVDKKKCHTKRCTRKFCDNSDAMRISLAKTACSRFCAKAIQLVGNENWSNAQQPPIQKPNNIRARCIGEQLTLDPQINFSVNNDIAMLEPCTHLFTIHRYWESCITWY